jgi:hypothetical protein
MVAHLLVFLSLSLPHTPSKPQFPKPIKVVTSRMMESVPVLPLPTAPPTAPVTKQTSVVTKEVPIKKPTPPKKVDKVLPAKKAVTVTPTKAAPSQKTAEKSQRKEELISLLESTLTQSKTKPSQSTHSVGNKNITLKSEGMTSSITTFEDELAIYLQNQLKMPYPGKIQLSLFLSAEGKLLEMEIKECKEHENRSYLERVLRTLLYPSFTAYFPQEKSRRVALTLYINGSK